MRTLQAVARADLGIDPPTLLTDRALARVGEGSVEGLLRLATRRGPGRWREPAVLAPVLLDTAEDGDPTAIRIVRDHGAALGREALAAARRVGIGDEPFGLALMGGVIRHPGRALSDAITDAVRAGAPRVRVVTPGLEPAAGALLLAFDVAGIAVDDQVQARLHASLPAAALFETHELPDAG
jgi:N-acetylglucosamine kinase-like BadF-type ATPase